VKDEIKDSIKQALEKLEIDFEPTVEMPQNQEFGDYTTNIALRLKMNPQELVKKIQKPDFIEKIEVKGGFINFWLSENYLKGLLEATIELNKSQKGEKIMIEFTDPNPFKEFHIGHLYSNVVGESISRILESAGAKVKRVNYQGDVGLHVAKSIWGIKKEMKRNHENLKAWEVKPLEIKIQFLAKGYALGNKAYEEDENARKEIIEINKKIYRKAKVIKEIYEKGKKWSLEYFEKIYKRLGTKFERYYFESEAGQVGLNLVKEYLKKGIFEKSDGAIIFPGEKYGLHNRVFVNSEGLPTYETKELGLAPTKYKDFPYNKSIIVTGNEINEYFKVVLAALSKINPDLASKTVHVSHGMVRLSGGKISSRLGNIISGESLLDDVKSKIKENFKDMDNDTAEKVTVAAVKYALLRIGIGKDIEFDINQSISLEGDSGPYLQYTYVRTQSLKDKADIKKNENKSLNEEEIMILRTLQKFPEVVEQVALEFAPNHLTSYLFDLAQRFNLFYQKHRIAENEFRLKLASKVGETIKNGLYLLGIEAPSRM